VNPYAILAAIALLAGSHALVWKEGRSGLRKELAAERAIAVDKARAEEQLAQKEVNDVQSETVKLLKSSNARADGLAYSLRSRPDRRSPSDSAATAQCHGATGAELSGVDGEFLARLAARAQEDAIKLNTLQIYVQKYCVSRP
jgi:hypothetical protein